MLCDAVFPVPDLDNENLDDSELGRHLLTAHPDVLAMVLEVLAVLHQQERE